MKQNKGFTLVEVMVAVGIIIVLAAIAIASGGSARSVARDNQRIQDIQLIQLKLESYHDQNGVYPGKLTDLVPNYIADSSLKDPKGISYSYAGLAFVGDSKCTNYHLGIVLETANSALSKAKHSDSGDICGGSGSDFAANSKPPGATSNLWYDVISPNAF